LALIVLLLLKLKKIVVARLTVESSRLFRYGSADLLPMYETEKLNTLSDTYVHTPGYTDINHQ